MEFTSALPADLQQVLDELREQLQPGCMRLRLDCRAIRSMPTVFKGRVFSVEVGTRRFPNGHEHDVAIVRHPPSVVLIPIEDDGRVVLVRQYRAPLDRETLGAPGGPARTRASRPRTPRAASARRRSGWCRTALERLRGLYPAPGFCDEELIFFRVVGPAPAAARLAAQAGRGRGHHDADRHDRRGAGDGRARRDRRSEDRLRADADLGSTQRTPDQGRLRASSCTVGCRNCNA